MNATVSATHLLRQFVLYAIVEVFLLLMTRAGYALWRFPAVEAGGKPLELFITGLRFDLSLVGASCLVPLVVGSLLGMFDVTRAVAKWFVLVWLVLSLAFVLLAELVTPYFLGSAEARPDASAFADLPGLVANIGSLAAGYPVPTAIGALLVVLILVAYVIRTETTRFLRYRLSRPSAVALAVFGGFLCVLAARSVLDFTGPALSAADASLGGEAVVDQIAMNSAWTTVRSLLAPLL